MKSIFLNSKNRKIFLTGFLLTTLFYMGHELINSRKKTEMISPLVNSAEILTSGSLREISSTDTTFLINYTQRGEEWLVQFQPSPTSRTRWYVPVEGYIGSLTNSEERARVVEAYAVKRWQHEQERKTSKRP